jgi:hypothetical protein
MLDFLNILYGKSLIPLFEDSRTERYLGSAEFCDITFCRLS